MAPSPGQRRIIRERASDRLLNGREGTRLMGGRKALRETAKHLLEVAADQVRVELADPDYVREFVKMLKHGASREVMDRTCIGIVGDLYFGVKANNELLAQLLASLGVSSQAQLVSFVGQAKSVEGVTDHEGAERMVAAMEQYLFANPQMRLSVVKLLGGVVPSAEVVPS